MSTHVMDDLTKPFAKDPIWTLTALAQQINYSEVSVRRFLKRIGYLRSFTHNGKFYTLKTMATFNAQGIWRYEQTGFSKHGTLMQTIDYLIHKSPMGLSAAELTGILGSPCQSFLSSYLRLKSLNAYLGADDSILLLHKVIFLIWEAKPHSRCNKALFLTSIVFNERSE